MSHYLIGVVCAADDESAARGVAQEALDRITGDSSFFDYGHLLDDPECTAPNWPLDEEEKEKVPAVADVKSPVGARVLALLTGWQKEAFMDDLKKLRAGLIRYSDEDLWKGSDAGSVDASPMWVRYRAGKVSDSSDADPHVRLYDGGGDAIRGGMGIETACKEGDNVYIVSLAVHG